MRNRNSSNRSMYMAISATYPYSEDDPDDEPFYIELTACLDDLSPEVMDMWEFRPDEEELEEVWYEARALLQTKYRVTRVYLARSDAFIYVGPQDAAAEDPTWEEVVTLFRKIADREWPEQCAHCGARVVETWRNADSFWSDDVFCSEWCAEESYRLIDMLDDEEE